MGAWSTALYGSDAALDMRGHIVDILRAPLDEDGIVDALRVIYPAFSDKSDEEYPDLWLALADQLHLYDVAAPTAFAAANAVIDSGLDLDAKRALGMTEGDLKKRAKVLDALKVKWSKPHPKPKKRKVQKEPDTFLFEIGDCIVFPVTQAGGLINPYFAKPEMDPAWKPVGYGAAVVLERGRIYGVFAWYAVARLALLRADRPSLDDCAAAAIDSTTTPLNEQLGDKPELCVYASRLTLVHSRRMQMETIGRLVVDESAIREDLARLFAPGFFPGANLANELSGWGLRQPSSIPIARYATIG